MYNNKRQDIQHGSMRTAVKASVLQLRKSKSSPKPKLTSRELGAAAATLASRLEFRLKSLRLTTVCLFVWVTIYLFMKLEMALDHTRGTRRKSPWSFKTTVERCFFCKMASVWTGNECLTSTSASQCPYRNTVSHYYEEKGNNQRITMKILAL